MLLLVFWSQLAAVNHRKSQPAELRRRLNVKKLKVEESLCCLFPSDCASFVLFTTLSASTREVRGLKWNKITQIPSPRRLFPSFDCFSHKFFTKQHFAFFFFFRDLRKKDLLCGEKQTRLVITLKYGSNNK